MQNQVLQEQLQTAFSEQIITLSSEYDEVTMEVSGEHLLQVCQQLKETDHFHFEQLIDVCGVDYLDYGKAEWVTAKATSKGFERAATRTQKINVLNVMKLRGLLSLLKMMWKK